MLAVALMSMRGGRSAVPYPVVHGAWRVGHREQFADEVGRGHDAFVHALRVVDVDGNRVGGRPGLGLRHVLAVELRQVFGLNGVFGFGGTRGQQPEGQGKSKGRIFIRGAGYGVRAFNITFFWVFCYIPAGQYTQHRTRPF
jgi:hypothetical protein